MDSIQEGDCAVCMLKYNHPAKLPCDHIFCFLCIKGVFLRSHKCPMCRSPIPEDYLDNPQLLKEILDEKTETDEYVDNKFWWYYEGQDGWWSYDERSNEDIESDFNDGKSECKLLVAGAVYCVDFTQMIQYRQSDPRRKRKVKRDTHTHPSKGIAGILKVCPKQVDLNTVNITANILDDHTDTIENNHENGDDIDNMSQILRSMSIQEPQLPSGSPNTEDT
ncbi:unnamed protein product [Pieris macdunnoughi]|uniref:E3 ubiquitin-protein ligase n=1 Tax=Pieris macdunnoughi TaxID=345717 RepID=A0A821QAM2_9NEOP|nr:unnamed protein product [Pieris macdunnoughi]